MNIRTFKTRYTNKKYCFDPNIPDECDYMEVRYPVRYILFKHRQGVVQYKLIIYLSISDLRIAFHEVLYK